MKSSVKYSFLLLFVFLNFTGFSQHKNSVKVYTQGLNFLSSNITFPNIRYNGFERMTIKSIAGVSYEREIKYCYGIGAQYAFWWGDPEKQRRSDEYPTFFYTNNYRDEFSSIGKQLSGRSYDTYDIYGSYQLPLGEYLNLALKFGPSITVGKNIYLKSLMYFSTGPLGDYTFEVEVKRGTYFGGLTSLSLDYTFWKDRIPVGLDLTSRYYHNFPFQLNYGLHTGFNF
jgi:hypothetical protein